MASLVVTCSSLKAAHLGTPRIEVFKAQSYRSDRRLQRGRCFSWGNGCKFLGTYEGWVVDPIRIYIR